MKQGSEPDGSAESDDSGTPATLAAARTERGGRSGAKWTVIVSIIITASKLLEYLETNLNS